MNEAIKLGEKIAEQSPLIVAMAKEVVNRAYETTLSEGLKVERRMFHATFATVWQWTDDITVSYKHLLAIQSYISWWIEVLFMI